MKANYTPQRSDLSALYGPSSPPIIVQVNVQENGMIATTYSNARANLKKYMDLAREEEEHIVITSKHGNSVLISEEEYNNLMENLYIISNPAMVARLKESLDQLAKGEVVTMSLDQLKAMEGGE